MILGAALALAACTPHEFPVAAGGAEGRDYPVQLVFSDEMPALRTVSATKADGSAATPLRARYNVQVFRYTGEFQYGLDPDYSFTFTRPGWEDLDTTVFLPVDPARYKVAVWTDLVTGTGASAYTVEDMEHIRVAENAGTQVRDAFCGTLDADLSDEPGKVIEPLVLTRPVAMIRFIAPEALTFLGRLGVDAASLSASLRYTASLPAAYNLLRHAPYGSLESPALSSVPEMNTDGELVFLSDFVLAPGEEGTVAVDFSLKDASGKELYSYAGDLPVKAAHVTTVTFSASGGGGGGTPGGIGIDPGFDDEIEVPIGID